MFKAICVAAAIGLTGIPAQAAVMQAAYTGTVTSAYDETGVFGASDPSALDGLAYTLTYIYDTALGIRTTNANSDLVEGGSYNATISPMLSAILTINGSSVSFSSAYVGQAHIYSASYGGTGTQHVAYLQGWSDSTISTWISDSVYVYGDWLDLRTPDLDLPVTLGSTRNVNPGYFAVYHDDIYSGGLEENAYGYLSVSSLKITSVSQPSPVPLPAALPLLAVALAGITGLRLRRRLA